MNLRFILTWPGSTCHDPAHRPMPRPRQKLRHRHAETPTHRPGPGCRHCVACRMCAALFIYLFVIFCSSSLSNLLLRLLLPHLISSFVLLLFLFAVFPICLANSVVPLFSLVILAAIILILGHAFIYQFLRRKQAVRVCESTSACACRSECVRE